MSKMFQKQNFDGLLMDLKVDFGGLLTSGVQFIWNYPNWKEKWKSWGWNCYLWTSKPYGMGLLMDIVMLGDTPKIRSKDFELKYLEKQWQNGWNTSGVDVNKPLFTSGFWYIQWTFWWTIHCTSCPGTS